MGRTEIGRDRQKLLRMGAAEKVPADNTLYTHIQSESCWHDVHGAGKAQRRDIIEFKEDRCVIQGDLQKAHYPVDKISSSLVGGGGYFMWLGRR